MVEDKPKEDPKEEADSPTFLDKAKAEREAMEKVRDDLAKDVKTLKDMKAQDILTGSPDSAPVEKKKEITDEDYAQAAREGKILE